MSKIKISVRKGQHYIEITEEINLNELIGELIKLLGKGYESVKIVGKNEIFT